jgi:hypothetical protein
MDDKKKQIANNVLKFAGEILIFPGTSQLVDRNWKFGVLHMAGGVLARTLIGRPAALLVAANSFSLSVVGKNLSLALFDPNGTRTVNLEKRVNHELSEGLTLEEIREGVLEDIEDIYQEAITEPYSKTSKLEKQET